MIKVGIAGADTKTAGELIRLCMHHPDIDLISVYSPESAGQPVSAIHHGFIGEPRMAVTSHFDATALDFAFLVKPVYTAADWSKIMSDRPGLKVVLFPESAALGDAFPMQPVYGLSEMNRKALVRGARAAVVPNPIAAVTLIGLYPLAAHLMLSGNLNIDVIASEDIVSAENLEKSREEIMKNLSIVQSSFSQDVNITSKIDNSESGRAMRISLELPLTTSLDEVLKVYDSIYDDHNFSYVVTYPVDTKEVEGTHKVVISVSKPAPDKLKMDIVADPRMRGGAGEAMHLFNLLCNLDETTGLALKTSTW